MKLVRKINWFSLGLIDSIEETSTTEKGVQRTVTYTVGWAYLFWLHVYTKAPFEFLMNEFITRFAEDKTTLTYYKSATLASKRMTVYTVHKNLYKLFRKSYLEMLKTISRKNDIFFDKWYYDELLDFKNITGL